MNPIEILKISNVRKDQEFLVSALIYLDDKIEGHLKQENKAKCSREKLIDKCLEELCVQLYVHPSSTTAERNIIRKVLNKYIK